MTRPAALGQRSWPQLDGSAATLLVPLGAVEQHGPHLPLDTDSRIAAAVARLAQLDLAETFEGAGSGGESIVLVAPELHYGASGEHEGFPGTVSLGHEALHLLLIEYGRSACRWAQRIVFVNGHGGNGSTLASAVRRLRYEGRDVAWFPCLLGDAADAHAGVTETSALLHLSPEFVRLQDAAAGNNAPIGELLPALREGGVAAVSANGVLGDPAGASAEEGRRMVEASAAALSGGVRMWTVDDDGRLT